MAAKRNPFLRLLILVIAVGLLWVTLHRRGVLNHDDPSALRPTAEAQYALAVEHHQASIGLEGSEQEAMLRRAIGEYDGVVQNFAESPYYVAESHLAIGHIHQLLGDTPAAVFEYEIVVERYTDQAFTRLQALKSMGDAYRASGALERAREAYETILADYSGADQPPAVRQVVAAVRAYLEDF